MSAPIASPRTIHMIEAVPERLEGSPRQLRRFWSDEYKELVVDRVGPDPDIEVVIEADREEGVATAFAEIIAGIAVDLEAVIAATAIDDVVGAGVPCTDVGDMDVVAANQVDVVAAS